MQSKWMSVAEIVSSKTIGFGVAMAITYWVVPFFWGVDVGAESAFAVTSVYTAAAFVRSYLFRRMFNWLTYKHEVEDVDGGYSRDW